jgi:hypothetical protein
MSDAPEGDRDAADPTGSDGDGASARDEAGSEGADAGDRPDDAGDGDADEELAALRREVESKYDFDDFGPEEMAEMTVEEWEAAFDPETWVVGEELLDRVERDLRRRVAHGEVFAVVERVAEDGEPLVVAYSDEGYAVVRADGGVEGRGTVLRDVKPTVALCSMDSYEVADPPADASLPAPEEVPEGSGEFGNLMLQIVAGFQVLAGVGLLVAWAVTPLSTIVAPAMAVVFLLTGLFLFAVVANARLSDRFRAEEYRERLRTVDLAEGERPEFLPLDPDDEEPGR